jgi:hypothetical protein
MIALDPTFVGRVDRAPAETIAEERRLAYEVHAPPPTLMRVGKVMSFFLSVCLSVCLSVRVCV